MDRKGFLKSITSLAVGGLPLAGLLESCSTPAPIIRTASRDKKVVLALNSLRDLVAPHSYAKVYVDQMSNPIIVFRRDGRKLSAVLSTCAH